MAKQTVMFNMDTGEVSALAGFLETLSTEIKTPRHMGPVMDYVFGVMSQEFNDYMDNLAGSNHYKYHHVYEWGTTDNPQPKDRLWTNLLMGRGGNRTVTWRWKASSTTVPVTAEAADKGVKQIHVFVWKAPFFEYHTGGLEIQSKRGVGISSFTQNGNFGLAWSQGPVWVNNPGGTEVAGAFTEAFVNWWMGGGSAATFDARVRHVLENDLGKSQMEKAMTKFPRVSRNKTFSMAVSSDARMAKLKGAAAAREFLANRDSKYYLMAAARAGIGGEIDE